MERPPKEYSPNQFETKLKQKKVPTCRGEVMSRMEMGKKLAQEICESFAQGKFDELKNLRCQYASPFQKTQDGIFSEDDYKKQIFSEKSKAKKAYKISQTLFQFFVDGNFKNIESFHKFLKKEKVKREVTKALSAKDGTLSLSPKDSRISEEHPTKGIPLMDRNLSSGDSPSVSPNQDCQSKRNHTDREQQPRPKTLQQELDQNPDSIRD